MNKEYLKEWLADVRNVCTVGITYNKRVYYRLRDYTESTLVRCLENLERQPPQAALKLPQLVALLDRAEHETAMADVRMPDKHTQEFDMLMNLYARSLPVLGVPAIYEMPSRFIELIRGDHNRVIEHYEAQQTYTGTIDHGTNWEAAREAAIAATAHLPGHSSGERLQAGAILDLFDGLSRPLPYNPNEREPGAMTPANRYHFDGDN